MTRSPRARRSSFRGALGSAVAALFAICALYPTPAPGLGGGSLTEPHCYNPTKTNADYEAYGPTDVNVQAGNGRVTVGENGSGTITVFKYPNPSFYNQVKYFALSRDAAGHVIPQAPNEGSFAGVFYRTRRGSGFAWLREWSTAQRYVSNDAPVPLTAYRSTPSLGLTVFVVDYALARGRPAFERVFGVVRSSRSPVTAARLVYYENFNPVGTRLLYLPITDWCLTQISDQAATYDAGSHSIVHSWQGIDAVNGRPTSVAFAFGWDRADSSHQVGGDSYDPATLPGGPADGYGQASSGTLGGSGAATGQVTGAIATDLAFGRNGVAVARMSIASGSTPATAVGALAEARSVSFPAQLQAVKADWRGWLARRLLPRSKDPRVVQVAKRSLITLRLAIDPDTGAIVASSDTQGPYGEDWIRDGSFINEMLDLNGLHDAVTKHNLFYARVQASPTNPSPIRPPGNWPMASYSDGVDGAPIPWEIDETGLGIWTLWHHAAYLPRGSAQAYLASVYPAISSAAAWLTACQDPTNGMQCLASEDDNYTPTQSLHGAETVYLGLRSAIAAAQAVGDTSPQVARWQARMTSLQVAIDALYDPSANAWREGDSSGNAYNVSYGDGGWLLWPVAFKSYADPKMRGEANAVRTAMDASFRSGHGEYEARGLLGLAHAWTRPTSAQRAELLRVLSYMATSLTTPTGLFGEAWQRYGGAPKPVEDQPHVWEHCLFYLAAIQIDGARLYSFDN